MESREPYLGHREERELAAFESRLRQALARREAPLGMQARVLARARERRAARLGRWWVLRRLAASVLLAAAVGGFAAYRRAEERRKGEAAREQVLAAMRIANRTLSRVQERLAEER